MSDLIVIILLILIIGGACRYIYKAKKKGHVKCIGCPYAGTCTSSCGNDKHTELKS